MEVLVLLSSIRIRNKVSGWISALIHKTVHYNRSKSSFLFIHVKEKFSVQFFFLSFFPFFTLLFLYLLLSFNLSILFLSSFLPLSLLPFCSLATLKTKPIFPLNKQQEKNRENRSLLLQLVFIRSVIKSTAKNRTKCKTFTQTIFGYAIWNE